MIKTAEPLGCDERLSQIQRIQLIVGWQSLQQLTHPEFLPNRSKTFGQIFRIHSLLVGRENDKVSNATGGEKSLFGLEFLDPRVDLNPCQRIDAPVFTQ